VTAYMLQEELHAPTLPARSNAQLVRRRFLHHKLAVASVVLLFVLCVACFGAPWLAPYPKNHVDLLADVTGPTAKHPFGVDLLGRDQLTEIMYAGRVSLTIGFVVALVSTILGVAVGAIAGYYGRFVDEAVSRTTDLFLIIPDIAFIAIILKWLGHTPSVIILVLGALGWMYVARIVRAQVMSIKQKEFVEAARAAGASNRRIMVRHILPNCLGSIFVNATLAIAAAVVAESTLAYLNVGLQKPDNSWGLMLRDASGATANFDQFYLIFFPGLMLILTILAVNFIGDGLRDAFDTKA
jgi:peptide/nickel transport system permease protein